MVILQARVFCCFCTTTMLWVYWMTGSKVISVVIFVYVVRRRKVVSLWRLLTLCMQRGYTVTIRVPEWK